MEDNLGSDPAADEADSLEAGTAATATAAPGTDPLLEQYKLAVEMADRVSARRATANAFFLTLNSALVVLVGLVHAGKPEAARAELSTDRFGAVVLSLAGVVLSTTWWLLLRSYRQLNGAKFTVVNAMERDLPAQPFNDEWNLLKGDAPLPWWKRYRELGTSERIVPVVYILIYVLACVRALTS